MTNYLLPVMLAAAFVSVQAFGASAPVQRLYPSFNVPRAKATITTFAVGDSDDVEPAAINNSGEVVGAFKDQKDDDNWHAFIREPDGTIMKFKAQGEFLTMATGVNKSGVVAGYAVSQATDVSEGFFRAANGKIMTFALPGTSGQVTGLNDEGDVTGFYSVGSTGEIYAFIRTANGAVTKFHIGDVRTIPAAIANDGTVIGRFGYGTSGQDHGFIRTPTGKITKLKIGALETFPTGINSSGVVVGYYYNVYSTTLAFERAANGDVTSFTLPDATTTAFSAINNSGTVTGDYEIGTNDGDFVQTSGGTVTTFLPPGATHGSVPKAINASGTIAGYYRNNNLKFRGFVRTVVQ